jgi:hypothetical protein
VLAGTERRLPQVELVSLDSPGHHRAEPLRAIEGQAEVSDRKGVTVIKWDWRSSSNALGVDDDPVLFAVSSLGV